MTATRLVDADYAAVLEVFLSESEEGLAVMEQTLLGLTAGGTAEDVQALFRVAHTVKGNASSLGLADLAEMAHVLEDVLERLRSGQIAMGEDVITLLLASVDALREMLAVASGRTA